MIKCENLTLDLFLSKINLMEMNMIIKHNSVASSLFLNNSRHWVDKIGYACPSRAKKEFFELFVRKWRVLWIYPLKTWLNKLDKPPFPLFILTKFLLKIK